MPSILVVDDESHVTRVLRLALERAGYEVEIACDGEQALAALGARAFDAMITDLCMPRMNGQELCEKVRREHRDQELLIFLMTSRAEDDCRDWVEGLDKVEFVEKPLSLRRLLARLEQQLPGSPAAGEAPS